jgi:hypothetical protein
MGSEQRAKRRKQRSGKILKRRKPGAVRKRARGDVVAAFRSTQPAEHHIQGKNAGKETPYSFCFTMIAAHYQV